MKSLIKNCLFHVFKHEAVTNILMIIGSIGPLVELIPTSRPILGVIVTFVCFCLCLLAMFVIKELEKFDEQTGKGSAVAVETYLKAGFPSLFGIEALIFMLY